MYQGFFMAKYGNKVFSQLNICMQMLSKRSPVSPCFLLCVSFVKYF